MNNFFEIIEKFSQIFKKNALYNARGLGLYGLHKKRFFAHKIFLGSSSK